MSQTIECPKCLKLYNRDNIVFKRKMPVQCMKCPRSDFHYYVTYQSYTTKSNEVKKYPSYQRYRPEKIKCKTIHLSVNEFIKLFGREPNADRVMHKYIISDFVQEHQEQQEQQEQQEH